MSNTADQAGFRLPDFFPYLVRLFYRDVSESVQDIYTAAYGLTVAEWRTMGVLNDHQPLSASEVVSRSSVDKVNVSRAIAGLQKHGFIERHVDPTDRRRVLLRLTAKGRKAMHHLVPLVLEVEQQLLSGLSEEEQAVLIGLMERVRTNAAAITPYAERMRGTEKVSGK